MKAWQRKVWRGRVENACAAYHGVKVWRDLPEPIQAKLRLRMGYAIRAIDGYNDRAMNIIHEAAKLIEKLPAPAAGEPKP